MQIANDRNASAAFLSFLLTRVTGTHTRRKTQGGGELSATRLSGNRIAEVGS